MSAIKEPAVITPEPASRAWTNRAVLAVFLLTTSVGAWIGLLYPLSPHASEIVLRRLPQWHSIRPMRR